MLKIKQVNGLQDALDSKIDDTQLSTDVNLGTSDLLIPSQNAVKVYVDAKTAALVGGMSYRGSFDAENTNVFSDLGSSEIGDFYYVISAGTVDGIELAIGDMIILNKTTLFPVAADIDKIDNTESPDLLHWDTDVMVDDSFATATNLNVPTSESVKNYLLSIAGNKEDSFTEALYEYTHIGATIPASTPIILTLPHPTIADFILNISVEGIELTSSEYSHTIGTTSVTVTLPFTLEAGEIISVIYNY